MRMDAPASVDTDMHTCGHVCTHVCVHTENNTFMYGAREGTK